MAKFKDPIYRGENITLVHMQYPTDNPFAFLTPTPGHLEINFQNDFPTAAVVDYDEAGNVKKSQEVKVQYVKLAMEDGINTDGQTFRKTVADYKIKDICTIKITDMKVLGDDRKTPEGLGLRKIAVKVAPKGNISRHYSFEEMLSVDIPKGPMVEDIVTEKFVATGLIDAQGRIIVLKDPKVEEQTLQTTLEAVTAKRVPPRRISQQNGNDSGRDSRG